MRDDIFYYIYCFLLMSKPQLVIDICLVLIQVFLPMHMRHILQGANNKSLLQYQSRIVRIVLNLLSLSVVQVVSISLKMAKTIESFGLYLLKMVFCCIRLNKVLRTASYLMIRMVSFYIQRLIKVFGPLRAMSGWEQHSRNIEIVEWKNDSYHAVCFSYSNFKE